MQGLAERGLVEVVQEAARSGKPLLGICLGMQLLFDESEEQGVSQGLGLVPGKVRLFENKTVKVPQIGWNQLHFEKANPLLEGLQPGDYVYFNHSYYCEPAEQADTLISTEYGLRYASSIQRGNLFGVQFHPEKSQRVGLQILRNFVGWQHD